MDHIGRQNVDAPYRRRVRSYRRKAEIADTVGGERAGPTRYMATSDGPRRDLSIVLFSRADRINDRWIFDANARLVDTGRYFPFAEHFDGRGL
jgi:hypothetical protein